MNIDEILKKMKEKNQTPEETIRIIDKSMISLRKNLNELEETRKYLKEMIKKEK